MNLPLVQRVNRRLFLLSLAASGVGSMILGGVTGFVVLELSLERARLDIQQLVFGLQSAATSFQSLYEVQREIQKSVSAGRLNSAELIDSRGVVLAASDSALINGSFRSFSLDHPFYDLPKHWRACIDQTRSRQCDDLSKVDILKGSWPVFGGERLVSASSTPLAIASLPPFVHKGYFVLDLDTRPILLRAKDLALKVFLVGWIPLFVTAIVIALLFRRQIIPELISLAQIDELSGVLNRRAFIEAAEHRIGGRLLASRTSLAAIGLVDIDCFKTFNDQFGHASGDRVIQYVSSQLLKGVRNGDLVGRLGGDEFAILLTAAPSDVHDIFERICSSTGQTLVKLEGGFVARATLSIGYVHGNDVQGGKLHELFQKADEALYQAKHLGRNQAVSYSTLISASLTQSL